MNQPGPAGCLSDLVTGWRQVGCRSIVRQLHTAGMTATAAMHHLPLPFLTHRRFMTSLSFPRLALVLGLLGGGAAISAGTALANPLWPGGVASSWRPNPSPHFGWVQAQRAWADQSYRQTQWRLDQLEQCLGRARQRWDNDQCLRRDLQARERQWQRDQQEWQAKLPWRPGLGSSSGSSHLF